MNAEKISSVGERESAAPANDAYPIGPGDTISIKVWRHDELNRTATVDAAGNIPMPLMGEMHVDGLTAAELRTAVVQHLNQYYVDPQVEVYVSDMQSRNAYVLGEIRSPGALKLDRRMLIWEAISRSGGFTNDANRKQVLLIRTRGNESRVYSVDTEQLFQGGTVNALLYLKNNDIIYILPSFIANLERFMNRFTNIIMPIVTAERAVVLGDEVSRIIRGEDNTRNVTISP